MICSRDRADKLLTLITANESYGYSTLKGGNLIIKKYILLFETTLN